MTDIVGTTGPDTLNGTTGDDIITGLAGNDTLNGDLGNDTLDGGTGTDILNGGEGNDTLLVAGVDSGDQFNGGNGTDTIRLAPVPLQFAGQNGLTSNYFFTAATINSVERLDFSTSGGANNLVIAGVGQFGNGFEVIGSAGTDSLIFFAGGGGTFTIPTVTRTNWTTSLAIDTSGDFIGLFASGNAAFTLNANSNHTGLEVLSGANGNDTLNGSNGQEAFIGSTGTDTMNGLGGDDLFSFGNLANTFNTFFGTTLNGGTGNDTLAFSGYVNFLGHFASIEKISLAPEIVADATHTARPATVLDVDSNFGDQLTGSITVEGSGTVSWTLLPSDTSFDGSLAIIAPGSNLKFEVYGETTNDTLIGTSTDDTIFGDEGNDSIQGGNGNDYLDGEDGNDTLTGGAGADTFAVSFGQDVITDFVAGTDLIDVSGAIGSFKILQPFMSQAGNNVVLSFIEGGVAQTTTLQNVNLANLNASSFAFGGAFGNFETGTAFIDTLFGSTSGDILDGAGGNDLIITGGLLSANGNSVDNISGGDGDDIIVINNSLTVPGVPGAAPANIYNGGNGTDTLRIVSFDTFTNTAPVNQSQANFAVSTISGFEKLELASLAGERNTVLFTLNQGNTALAGVTVSGGAGGDAVVFITPNAAGDYSMPNLTRVNWNLDQSNVVSSSTVLNSDMFVLYGVGTGNLTLRTNANHVGLEALLGAGGNDTLIGGNDADWLDGGIDGADILQAGGGNDLLVVTQNSNQGNYANDSFDGGTGTDYLSVNGNVTFAGTLTGIEGILLAPAVPAQAPNAALGNGQLMISDTIAQQFGVNALLKGIGSVTVNKAGAGTLDLSGWQFLSDPITVQVAGSTQSDVITGTSHGDALSGGAGDDILVGGAGVDQLDGGDGNDRIVYDANDDLVHVQGGAGNDILVVFGGDVLPTSFDLSGQGFEAALQSVQDTGSNSWTTITNSYNGLWHLTQSDTTNDDGTRVVVDLDPENVAATSQVWSVYDSQNRLDSIDQIFDAGGHTFTNFDQANASAMAQDWFVYDSQNRLDNEDVYYDDGTRTFINVDEASNQTWTQDWFAYDAQSRLSSEDVLYDDGTRTFINLDEASNQTWTQDWFAYDALGHLSSEDVFYDNGTRTYINLDENNSQVWSQAWFTYDNQGRLDTQDVFNDDGSRIFYNYDQDNSQTFTLTAFLYDNTGHAYQQVIAWDDGSMSYVNL